VYLHLDPVSAPGISATGVEDMTSFTLMVTPPATSPQCVRKYTLVVRQEGVVIANSTFMANYLDSNNTIGLKHVIGSDASINTCKYSYTFELTPVNGQFSSGVIRGNPNLGGMTRQCNDIEL